LDTVVEKTNDLAVEDFVESQTPPITTPSSTTTLNPSTSTTLSTTPTSTSSAATATKTPLAARLVEEKIQEIYKDQVSML
jgi:hypothetical protein